MEPSSFLSDILFIIVLYERTPEKSDPYISITAISKENNFHPTVLFYDNSRVPSPIDGPGIIYIHDKENHGVSKGYNHGAALAKRMNKPWMLLLDQDTMLTLDVLTGFAKAVSAFRDQKVFVPKMMAGKRIVSPFKSIFGKGLSQRSIVPGLKSFRQYEIINSGMLIETQTFEEAGGYDEDFQLDLSDAIFSERLSATVEYFVLIEDECVHSLSSTDLRQNFVNDLDRFKRFNKAAKKYKAKSNKVIFPSLMLIPRSLSLSWKHKKLSFIRAAFETLISKP